MTPSELCQAALSAMEKSCTVGAQHVWLNGAPCCAIGHLASRRAIEISAMHWSDGRYSRGFIRLAMDLHVSAICLAHFAVGFDDGYLDTVTEWRGRVTGGYYRAGCRVGTIIRERMELIG